MKLNELRATPGAMQDAKRIGRGHGSGNGKTAGKGHKGPVSYTHLTLPTNSRV